jgi:ATP-binding cassette subfamily F protein 3
LASSALLSNKAKLKQCLLDKSALEAKLETVELEWMTLSEEYETALAE